MKYLDACLVVLATLHSAAAAVTSVDQLLDRFAVNADLYQRSFVTHVETNRVILSQAAGQDKPQERREQTRVVFWWDGQRMREQRYTWGDFATGTIDRAHARYESHLMEVDRSISYFASGGPSQEASLTYYAGSTPKGSVFDRVISGAGSWSWGYFVDGAGSREIASIVSCAAAKARGCAQRSNPPRGRPATFWKRKHRMDATPYGWTPTTGITSRSSILKDREST